MIARLEGTLLRDDARPEEARVIARLEGTLLRDDARPGPRRRA